MTSGLKRFQQGNCLHFLTFSCYRRQPLLGTPTARSIFEEELERIRLWYGIFIRGYVVMPEHVHLLVSEPERKSLVIAIQILKQTISRKLRPSEQPHFWLPRYYDVPIWNESKSIEKLRYIHRNPVMRELVQTPDQWEWSSFRAWSTGFRGRVEVESMRTAQERERRGENLKAAIRELPTLPLPNPER